MLADPDHTVEIAARGARFSGLAFAGKANPIARIDAGRDVYFQLPPNLHATLSVAGGTWISDDDAAAAAARAGLLDAKKALIHEDRAVPLAAPAVRRAGAAPITHAATVRAVLLARDRNRLGGAAERFNEVDLQRDLKVAAAMRSMPAAALT